MAQQLLLDHRIMLTGVYPTERESLAALAAALGGEVTSLVSRNDLPHLVITRSVASARYRAIMRADPRVPVLLPEWLRASVAAGRLLPHDGYRVGAFAGLTVCFSGLAAKRKAALAEQVEARGGTHSPPLDKRCTHLVTNAPGSEKYEFARREGIQIVTVAWVEDSMARGWCQEEEGYRLAGAAQPAAAPLAGGGAGASRIGADGGWAPAPVDAAAFRSVGARALASLPSDEATTLSQAALAPTLPMRSTQQAEAFERQIAPTAALRSASDADAGPAEAAPSLARAAQRGGARHGGDLEWDDATPPFLDAVRLRCVGCAPAEVVEVLRLVRQGAAKRFVDPVPGLTHMVVGSELSAAEAASLLDYVAETRRCAVVGLDWLRDSVRLRQAQPLGERYTITPAMLQRPAHLRGGPAAAAPPPPPFAATRTERSASGATASGAAASGGDSAACRAGAPHAAGGGIFDGCFFTLAALQSRVAELRLAAAASRDPRDAAATAAAADEEAELRQLVPRHGGRLFGPSSVNHVQQQSGGDRGRVFAVCPHSLTSTAAAQLRNSCPDFKLVDEGCRVTPFWVQCCLVAGKRVAHATRSAPCYRPLPYRLPLPGMGDVMVCVSGYDAGGRESIRAAVEIVGGRVSMDAMTRACTHLLLPVARGAKYDASERFGVLPVTADWLIDTINGGRIQPEERYHPPLPAGAQPAQTADSTRGSSGAAAPAPAPGPPPSSQVAATQGGGGRPLHAPLSWVPSQHPSVQPRQQQQQQQGSGGEAQPQAPGSQRPGRGPLGQPTLRERMQRLSSQGLLAPAGAAAATSGAVDADALASGLPPAVRRSNDENSAAPLHAPPIAAAVAAAAAAPCLPVGPPPAQGRQSALDAALEAVDGRPASAASDQALAPLPPPQQQQAEQAPAQPPAPQQDAAPQLAVDLVRDLFGSDEAAHPRQEPAARAPAAATAAASAAPTPAPDAPPAPEAAPSSAGRHGSRRASGPGGSAKRGTRSSARLRPAAPEEAAGEAAAVPEEAAGEAVAAQDAAGEAAARGVAVGSEPGEDLAASLDLMVDQIGLLFSRVAAEQAPPNASQADKPPPPPRARPGKRGAEEGAASSGGTGVRGGRAKRAAVEEGGAGRVLRRSGRGRAEEAPPVEMSQQVGYEAAALDMPTRGTRTATDAEAKQRLRQVAASGRGGRRAQHDVLADLMQ